MRSIVLTILGATFLLACSGGAGTMDGIMQSWQGTRLDAVIAQWGYPHEQRDIAGRRLYLWHRNTTLTTPVTSNTTVNVIGNTAYTTTHSYGGTTSNWNCTRILEVNRSEFVVGWQWQGNNCPFAEAFQYANWRNRSPVSTGGTVETASIPAPAIDLSNFRDVRPYDARIRFESQLWEQPGFAGEVLAELSEGTTVEVEREADNWLFVRLKDGSNGYVGRSWVQHR